MQPMTAAEAQALQLRVARRPRFFAFLQVSAVTSSTLGTVDPSKMGSQIVLDQVLSSRVTKILQAGADEASITFDNTNGAYSPLLSTSTNGRYVLSGLVDNKIQVYSSIEDNQGNVTAIPVGVFVVQSFNQHSENGVNQATIDAFDQCYLLSGDVYAQFPPRLYGNQTSSFFNPYYALKNPSGDGVSWVCDAINWMSSANQAPYYASDFVAPVVYVGSPGLPASTPTTLLYSVDYAKGQVDFSSPIPSDSIVSVDARPLGMAPELMLYHLLTEFASFDPSFFKFDNSGVILPIIDHTIGSTMLQIAQQIAMSTQPRGIPWQFYFDELGYICFREMDLDGPVVETLIDEQDLLSVPAEYTAQNLYNIVRAQTNAITQQPIEIISYDVNSINVYGQQYTYDVPSNMISATSGMDPLSAVGFLSGICNSVLFQNANPSIKAEVEILYNPYLEMGDVVCIRENKTGIDRNFQIEQITLEYDAENIKQKLRVHEIKQTQDYQFGIGGVAGAPIPLGNTGIGQTALISAVSINGTQVVSNGQPVTDSLLNPVVPTWDGSSLPISISTVGVDTLTYLYNSLSGVTTPTLWIWRAIVLAEDAYVISGSPSLATQNGNSLGGGGVFPSYPSSPTADFALDLTGSAYEAPGGTATFPYDFRAGFDTASSRRFFRPLLRCSDWLSNDGITGYTTAQTFNSTWTGGPGLTSSAIQFYGEMRFGMSDYFKNTSSGFVGQELFAANTPAATLLGLSSTVKYGVDWGSKTFNGSMSYGINKSITPCYLLILVASNAGIIQAKRIPFNLVV